MIELTLNSYTPLCTVYAQNAHYAYSKKLEVGVKTDFKCEFSTLKLGKNGYFCACLNFFVNQCYIKKM